MLTKMGVKVHERHILPGELEDFSQCWLTGSAAEITPVGQIGNYNFEVGELTQAVSKNYEQLVRE
jgi:branched-chain amino acid aminotransferase